MDETAEIADVDGFGTDGRRRLADQVARGVLPAQRAGREVERDEVAVAAADVDDSVGNGGRRLDDVASVVGPENLERGRRSAGRDPGLCQGAAKLRPLVGCCRHGRRPLLRRERSDDSRDQQADDERSVDPASDEQVHFTASAKSWLRLFRNSTPLAGTTVA